MKRFLRILAYIKPYWVHALLNVISNIMVILFSLVTFVMLIPFLNLLFGIEALVVTRPEIHFSAESVMGYLNFYISQIIIDRGKVEALLFICLFLLTTFFFRNLFRFLAMFFLAKVRGHAVRDIRNEIYHKILILPLSYYNQRKKRGYHVADHERCPGY